VSHWEYLRWVVYAGGAMGVWRYLPLTVIRLAAAFTKDECRHRRCMEVLRLARRDASHIPSYVTPAVTPTTPVTSVDAVQNLQGADVGLLGIVSPGRGRPPTCQGSLPTRIYNYGALSWPEVLSGFSASWIRASSCRR
jgi:hypothetical protein